MKKRKTKAAPKPKPDQAWFERKIGELGRELEKLPAERRKQFERELERTKKA